MARGGRGRPAPARAPRARRLLGVARRAPASRCWSRASTSTWSWRCAPTAGAPAVTYLPLPHPSGLAVDRARATSLHVASTRNPNAVFDLEPVDARSAAGNDAAPTAARAPARARPLALSSRRPLPARPGARRRRPARQRRRPERRRAAPRRRAATSASGGRAASRRPAARASPATTCSSTRSPPDRRLASLVLLRLGRRSVSAPARAPQLPRRRPRRDLLRRHAASRSRAASRARTRRACMRGRLWVGNSGYGEVGVVERRPLRRRGAPARLDARARLRGRRRVRRHVARPPALPPVRARARRRRQRLRRPRGRHPHRARCSAACIWPYGNQIFAIELAPGVGHIGLAVRGRRRRRATASGDLFFASRPRALEERGHERRLSPLLMLGAMYENGGNTTHRFLDGHPELFVYPFESQLGTRLVTDELVVDVSRSSTAGRSSRSTRRRRRTTAPSSTRSARSARARRT